MPKGRVDGANSEIGSTHLSAPGTASSASAYSLCRIALLWLGATLPVLIVARVLVPWLSPHWHMPPVKLFWLSMPLAVAVQFALVAWAVRRDTGVLTRESVKQRLRLQLPQGRAGSPGVSRLWWILRWSAGHLLITAFTLILPVAGLIFLLQGVPFGRQLYWGFVWLRPAGFFDHASASFAAQWSWVVWILAVWAFSVCAEEFLFRGVLLPAMKEKFGRAHGFINGLLFGLYSIPNPWALPFRLLSTIAPVRTARILGSTVPALAMRGVEGLFLAGFLIAGVQTQTFGPLPGRVSYPSISRQPPAYDFHRGAAKKLPPPEYAGTRDLRSRDLSNLDLRNSVPPLALSQFDDRTKWPSPDRMPAGFDAARILELGKNPGLGVRQLHAQGITGRGVGIAIIDRVLLTGHEEYAANLDWYEEIDAAAGECAQVHAPAVASIAVGRSAGVAPGARLFFIGMGNNATGFIRKSSIVASSVRRIIELNQRLPEARKIRALSMSFGWEPGFPGTEELDIAVDEAKAAGIFVISSSIARTYGFNYDGLGRPELADPDIFESYEPGRFWADQSKRVRRHDRLLIPMDSRTTASPTGDHEYAFYRAGGWSWSAPYIAGVYALAAQVDPGITPQKFWNIAMQTGRTITLHHDGTAIPFGPIIDPPAVVAAVLRGGNTGGR